MYRKKVYEYSTTFYRKRKKYLEESQRASQCPKNEVEITSLGSSSTSSQSCIEGTSTSILKRNSATSGSLSSMDTIEINNSTPEAHTTEEYYENNDPPEEQSTEVQFHHKLKRILDFNFQMSGKINNTSCTAFLTINK